VKTDLCVRYTERNFQMVLLLLLLCASLLSGASLSATVKDPSGATVAGAAVSAESNALKSQRQSVTDGQGRARFDEIAPGSYRISVNKDGFDPWERTVAVGTAPVEVSVALKLKVVTTTVSISARRSPLANSDPNYIAMRGGKLTKVYRVENLVLTRDVGKFTFRSGSFSFLPPVLGHVTTGVFVGDGNFQMKPAYDLAVKHLHRFAGVDAVDEDFTAVVIYFSDSTFDEIKQHSELADESPQRHEDAFKRVKNVIESRREPPSPLMRGAYPLTLLERLLNYEDIPNYDAEILAELYNPGRQGSFRAFLHGKQHSDLRFLLNPSGAMPMLAAPEEIALLNFDPSSSSDGVWYLSHLLRELETHQASSSEDKRLIAPEHYQMQIFIGSENLIGKVPDLAVSCDLRFHSLDEGTRMVKFDMVPDLQVSRVAWEGKDIPFVQESRKQDGSFYLQMPEPLVKGRSYQVTFEYAGGEILQSQLRVVPPRRVWYPTPAGPASRATYDLTFRVPRGMTVVSAGNLAKQSRDGSSDLLQWVCDVPITQAVFRYLADPYYKTTIDQTTGMALSAYVTSGGRGISSSANDVLIDTGNSVRVFNAWFGKPSLNSLSVVVGGPTDSLPGLVYAAPFVTMGYSSLASLALARQRDGRGFGLPPTLQTYLDEAFPREVARQWWGNTVSPATLHDVWLSTGLANFSTSLYDLEAYLKPEEFRDHWVKAREAILLGNRGGFKANETGPVWMGVLNDSFRTPGAGNILAVSKGGYIIHMLRSMMWDPKTNDADFQAMMQDFFKQFANRNASSEDFIGVVEKHMKPSMDLDRNHHMDWFFVEWLYGSEVPSYHLEYSLTKEKDGKTLLSGKLTQSGVLAGFKMVVPLFAELASKKVRVGVLALRGSSTGEFKVLMPEAPKRVMLNLNHDVLTDHEDVKVVK
jgi:Carboxypeptidase regulatory-like domain/Peptidase family M1 domain